MRNFGGRALGLILLVAAAGAMIQMPVATQGRPNYRVDPWWPRPFTNQSWVLGSITGVTVDAQNHVWVVHRGGDSLEANEKGMMLTPPSAASAARRRRRCWSSIRRACSSCSWGGPGAGYAWPQQPGGIAVDAKGNVWIAAEGLETAPVTPARGRGDAVVGERPLPHPRRGRGAPAGPADGHLLKFSRDGKFLLKIGTPGKNGRSRQPDHARTARPRSP